MPYLTNLLLLLCVFSLLALSAHVALGQCGLLCLGQAGFFAVGAYASALVTRAAGGSAGLYFMAGGAALCAATLAGALVAWACLRLQGDYFAVATLCAGEIIRLAAVNTEVLGGARGLGNLQGQASLALNIACALLAWVGVVRLQRAGLARRWILLREDALAAECGGVARRRYQLAAFAVAAALAGLAGHVFCQTQAFVHPSAFGFQQSVTVVLMAILGGLGSWRGALLGAGIFVLLPELLRFAGPELSGYRMAVFALGVLLCMLFRPQGLVGVRNA